MILLCTRSAYIAQPEYTDPWGPCIVFHRAAGHCFLTRPREEAGHRGREAETTHAKPCPVHARGGEPGHVQPDPALQLPSLQSAERAGATGGGDARTAYVRGRAAL